MARVYFSLGSNQGDRMDSLVKATKLIGIMIGEVVRYSAVVESEPWGFDADTNFYNQVIMAETDLDPQQVLSAILEIEKKLGRIRSGTSYHSRIIDVDLLFYDEMVMNVNNLVIPHPMLHLRKFVLLPLAEISPGFIHPVFQVTIAALLGGLEDGSLISVAVEKKEFAELLDTINLD